MRYRARVVQRHQGRGHHRDLRDPREGPQLIVGSLRLDVLLGDVSSLKGKRGVVRPVLAALRRLDVSVAETGAHDLYRRAELGVAAVGADAQHVRLVLEGCERLVAARPELELLSARLRIVDDEDE